MPLLNTPLVAYVFLRVRPSGVRFFFGHNKMLKTNQFDITRVKDLRIVDSANLVYNLNEGIIDLFSVFREIFTLYLALLSRMLKRDLTIVTAARGLKCHN